MFQKFGLETFIFDKLASKVFVFFILVLPSTFLSKSVSLQQNATLGG
jgi:hypothetical protein